MKSNHLTSGDLKLGQDKFNKYRFMTPGFLKRLQASFFCRSTRKRSHRIAQRRLCAELLEDRRLLTGTHDFGVATIHHLETLDNNLPTLDSISNRTIDEDGPPNVIQLTGITPGFGESQDLRISVASNNTGVIPNPSITYISPDLTGSLSFQAAPNKSGIAVIDVTVEDAGIDNDLYTLDDNASLTHSFTITVNEVNDTPTLNLIDSQIIAKNATQRTVLLNGINAGDSESQPVRITATSDNVALIPNPIVNYTSPNKTGYLSLSPAADITGGSVITVTVEDGGQDGDLNTPIDNQFFQQSFSADIHNSNVVSPLRDINSIQGGVSSSPDNFVQVGETLYFVATNWLTNRELWKTDGTAAGTVLVKDIFAGSNSSSNPSNLTNVNGTLYFQANDGTSGNELWKSDGTQAGTVRVKDVQQGSDSSSPSVLINVGGTLYFSANDGTSGSELWKSDGTEAGTVRVKDVQQGSSGSTPSVLTNVNGTLYFTANDGSSGIELWKSDGSDAGTLRVRDIVVGSGGTSPRYLTNVNGMLYFQTNSGTIGAELWKSDGTEAGTVRVKDKWSRFSPRYLTNVSGTLYFRANDGTSGYELWKSDGTQAGTVRVKDVSANSSSSSPNILTNVNGTLYFTANDGIGGTELWKSDGSEVGTVRVKDISAGSRGSYPRYITNVNGTLYFQAYTQASGFELWKSDGTQAGTVRVKDIRTNVDSSSPSVLTNVNGTLYFNADDGRNGTELWKSDGTEAGTVQVKEIGSGSRTSKARYLTNVNGTVYFRANDGTSGEVLWKSNGTSAGTVRVKDIRTGSPRYLTNVNGTLYFEGYEGTSGAELWRSDGTEPGTVLVKDVWSGINSSSLRYLTNVNGTLYFRANDGTSGYELWKSDGTGAGTVLVKDIWSGVSGSAPHLLANVNGSLFMTANDGTTGFGLWKTDGTDAGTVFIKGINGILSSFIWAPTSVNDTLFFTATDGTSGFELWKSDGTDAGTVRVKDLEVGTGSSSPEFLTNVNGTLYFRADGLWKSDGTEVGTVRVKDISVGSTGSTSNVLINVSGTLYFSGNEFAGNTELWKSDGTEAGTVIVKDIWPGTSSSSPSYLTNVNGTLYFIANDGRNGAELWKSDGTAGGTRLVADVEASNGSSVLDSLTAAGNQLFFTADTIVYGRELYSIETTSGPTSLSLMLSTIPENSALNSIVGILTTSDSSSLDSFTYTIVAGDGSTNNADFFVDGDRLKIRRSFDYETKSTYSIRVRTTDSSGMLWEQPLTITITDINEPPSDVSLSSSTIDENAGADAVVGSLSATDPDSGNTFAFSLPVGLGSNNFFNISGTSLRANASFNFEAQASYPITVRVTDNGGQTFDKALTINVTNINDASINHRRIFYHRSTSTVFGNGSGNPINAIDPTKQALLPGGTTTTAHYTNYSRGINGIVVDITDITNLSGITDASFQFATWSNFTGAIPNFVTISPTVTVSTFGGGGLNSSDRVKLEFPNNEIQNAWLRVTILANANTGLTTNDVFYFGNARLDVTPTSPFPSQQVTINIFDTNAIRAKQGQNSGGISNVFDVDRNGVVNIFDTNAVRAGQGVTSLRFFTAPSSLSMGMATARSNTTANSIDTFFADTRWLESFQFDYEKNRRPKRV